MSRIRADRLTDKAGTGAPILVNGVQVTGKSTLSDVVGAAVTFNSITGNLTGNVTGNADTSSGFSGNPSVNTTGIITATTFSGNVTGVAATFTGDVSIGGTLTYEDVNNIDSVGIVTARSGFKLTGGNYSTECIREPLDWIYHASDLRQLKDIHSQFGTLPLSSFPTSEFGISVILFSALTIIEVLATSPKVPI